MNELERQNTIAYIFYAFLFGILTGVVIWSLLIQFKPEEIFKSFPKKFLEKNLESLQKEILKKEKKLKKLNYLLAIFPLTIFLTIDLFVLFIGNLYSALIYLIIISVFILIIMIIRRKMKYDNTISSNEGLLLFLFSLGVFISYLFFFFSVNGMDIIYNMDDNLESFIILICIFEIPNLTNCIIFMSIGIYYFLKKRGKIQT